VRHEALRRQLERRQAVQNIPNGYTCRYGYQCISGRCELNTNGDKVCASSALPAYVSPFFPDVP